MAEEQPGNPFTWAGDAVWTSDSSRRPDLPNPHCPDLPCPHCPDLPCTHCPDLPCTHCPDLPCTHCPDLPHPDNRRTNQPHSPATNQFLQTSRARQINSISQLASRVRTMSQVPDRYTSDPLGHLNSTDIGQICPTPSPVSKVCLDPPATDRDLSHVTVPDQICPDSLVTDRVYPSLSKNDQICPVLLVADDQSISVTDQICPGPLVSTYPTFLPPAVDMDHTSPPETAGDRSRPHISHLCPTTSLPPLSPDVTTRQTPPLLVHQTHSHLWGEQWVRGCVPSLQGNFLSHQRPQSGAAWTPSASPHLPAVLAPGVQESETSGGRVPTRHGPHPRLRE